MRDIVSCLNENAITASNPASCSSYSNKGCISPNLIPSTQNSITSLYKIILSTQKQILVTVSWIKNNATQGLNINFGSDSSTAFKLNTSTGLFRKKKGAKLIDFDDLKIEVFWDLSSAKYDIGPAPVDGFYVLVMLDSEVGLVLGDNGEETINRKLKLTTPMAKSTLVSRQERCSGSCLYTTKAQFCDEGTQHEIMIKYSGENEGLKHPILSVCIDKKMVIRVKRLQWNFRGNQTIFVDGLLVDLMWDVHDWFYSSSSGSAVFMFRTRNGIDSRLWLDDKLVAKDQDRVDFSLLIYACKTS